MRISKTALSILAMAVVFVFAFQPAVQAGENLTFWPLEPDVSAGFKTKATFAGYEYGGATVDAVYILRVRTGSSNQWSYFSATAGPYDYTDDPARQQAISDFLNPMDFSIVGAICPDCPIPSYIHLKRATDDGATSAPPYGAIADFELVINQDPPMVWFPPPTP